MNGVIPLWKPKGMTSHDCVSRIRQIFKTKKVGHTGTLDPDAEGVLPICVGKATKIASLLTLNNKEYEAEISLGQSTTTEDLAGEIVEKKNVDQSFTIDECESVLSGFQGWITQVPPMYSAIRVDGKRLYEYAREGIEVERPSRQVNIYEIKMLSDELTWYNDCDVRFNFKVACSSGTYIRTLCVDIGHKLGYPAHMSRLIRTQAGDFPIDQTVTFEELEQSKAESLISLADVLTLPSYTISPDEEYRFRHGQVLELPEELEDVSTFKVITESNELIAVYQHHPSKVGKMKPYKVF
ncbi:tRNA pseudouridine(55) synthase TruB [Aquisalibacillus elongatus]|uniref:tRNA pseudouridine synthase B n=1 Tax=Aquisalibacillus elongatus TaxID=485577 RepID=A0A3N5BL95_9BACI|nr:tRNA pseudouridine(55) synthase TruB [Aquisalibacillus elongatus]RPF55950.1 tRNA pseudouridine synthase B [Aquisalibacillus elongatus]